MAAYNFVIDTGTVTVDTSSLLSDVQTEFQTALGANINLASSTPQGSLMTAEAIARAWVMKNNSDVANLINPNLSYGSNLDAICALTGTKRGTNISTSATVVTITGVLNTVIPAGNRVETSNGDIFLIQTTTTIPSGGTTTVTLVAQQAGPIPMPAPATLTILDGVIGWGTCATTNSTVVTLGQLALNDAQLKVARKQQLAVNGVGSSLAVGAALSAVPNVTSFNVVENNTGATGTVNGINFTLANALWVCVAGTASNSAIASALYAAHPGGIPWDYGNTGMGTPVSSPNGVSVLDPATNLSYNVKWTTPIAVTGFVYISVHLGSNSAISQQAVVSAIMNYVQGLESGEAGLVIGAAFSSFEIAASVGRQLPGVYIKLCKIATGTQPSGAPPASGWGDEYVTAQYQQVGLVPGNIQVVPV